MDILNLMPHAINILDDTDNVIHTIAPSGFVARVVVQEVKIWPDNLDNYIVKLGDEWDLQGLPPNWRDFEGVVVSDRVLKYMRDYMNWYKVNDMFLLTLGSEVFDANGSSLGFRSLITNN